MIDGRVWSKRSRHGRHTSSAITAAVAPERDAMPYGYRIVLDDDFLDQQAHDLLLFKGAEVLRDLFIRPRKLSRD